MVKISVIIPLYNVENFIEETLNSLLNQTIIDDIEVLMIDDGSTDNSRYIIEKYALDYDNFYAFHKENEGQGVARNFGLKKAKGEYIHFLDADDFITPDAYEKLYNFNPENDFIVGNVLKFAEYNVWENILFKNAFKDFPHDIKSFTFKEYPSLIWDTICCNKLFKREFLEKNDITFSDKNIFYEDLLFSFKSYMYADSIGFSHDAFYYWRLRVATFSVTQEHEDVRNFKDRLEILRLFDELMDECSVSDDMRNMIYSKWLNHDLRTSLYKIRNYPEKYYSKLIDDTISILNLIPDDLKNDLNTYKTIVYEMVKNKDIDSLLAFTYLEDELKENPNIEIDIDKKYLNDIDFTKDAVDEEFRANLENVEVDGNNIAVDFSEHVNYLSPDWPHESEVYLVGKNYSKQLEVTDNQFKIPISLIKDKTSLSIKVVYKTSEFVKESYLRNFKRKCLRFDNFDVELHTTVNRKLKIDYVSKDDNEITITDITFKDNTFNFEFESEKPINEVFIKNFIDLSEITYKVENNKFSINYEDICIKPIKKWELNSHDSLNSIKLNRNYEFFTNNSKIKINNGRNKILIRNFIIDHGCELYLLNKENDELNQEISELKNQVKEFRSRKIVRLVDKIKNIF